MKKLSKKIWLIEQATHFEDEIAIHYEPVFAVKKIEEARQDIERFRKKEIERRRNNKETSYKVYYKITEINLYN